ncbi:response regulator [Oceanobacillus halophilus]|uniref:Response regulator n=1 Tax=Oceanobacillus halophilus TaxID=930130 RepID=A0A495ACH8_9BACI|nr:response regulator [Oceanobacillus halophilus]RKQ37572.1 response regulator [Oceanobacillus halophilus]
MAKILVVDDAKFMRMTLGEMLQKANHEIVGEAINGEEAVSKYIELSPDIVTMDITMPGVNGIEATREIIKHNQKANIIICSAMGQQKVINEAIEAGAKDYLIKPFDENQVIETMNRLIYNSKQSVSNT